MCVAKSRSSVLPLRIGRKIAEWRLCSVIADCTSGAPELIEPDVVGEVSSDGIFQTRFPAQNHVGEKRSGEDLSQRPALEDRRSIDQLARPSLANHSQLSITAGLNHPRHDPHAAFPGNAVPEHVIDVRGLHKHGAT
jgi:hypothetical protein